MLARLKLYTHLSVSVKLKVKLAHQARLVHDLCGISLRNNQALNRVRKLSSSNLLMSCCSSIKISNLALVFQGMKMNTEQFNAVFKFYDKVHLESAIPLFVRCV